MPITLLRRERRFYELFDRAGRRNVGPQPRRSCYRDALADRERRDALDTKAAIKDLEHAGDELTHEIIQTLHRTFITPFEREDIYALSSGLDDVLDYIDEIAETIILLRHLRRSPPAAKSMASLHPRGGRADPGRGHRSSRSKSG